MQPTPLPCPFVGLQPFAEADREYFFGREHDQRIIISNLLASPLTILYGVSGVGKSSVLMAGVLPQLRRDQPTTPVVVFRDWVGADFQRSLTRACIDAVWQGDIGQSKPAETLPFDEILKACGKTAHETVLLLFDQFEEYFLYHPKSSELESFEAQFARAVNREDVDVGFLIVVREDSISKLDRFRERIPNLLSNRLVLRHLDEAGAAVAIRGPLDVWNRKYAQGLAPVTIEDGLATELIKEIELGRVTVGQRGGSGATQQEKGLIEAPFLQLVMTRLWAEETSAGSRVIRLATFRRLGGAETIVRSHLDGAMAQLDATSQAVCSKFFDRLVTPSGSKVACSRDDLRRWAGPLAPSVPSVLEALSHARILRTAATPADNPDTTSYEIYHDVLAPAILEWRRVYIEAQDRAEQDRRAREQARAKAQKMTWLAVLAFLAVLLVIAVLAVPLYRGLYIEAENAHQEAEALELSLKAETFLSYDPELPVLIALKAAQLAPGKDEFVQNRVASGLANAMLRARTQITLAGHLKIAHNGSVSALAFSSDGTRLATAGKEDGTVTVWQVVGDGWNSIPFALLGTLSEKGVTALAFTPDGTRLAVLAGRDGMATAKVWTISDGRAIQLDKGITASAVSLNGQSIATATEDGTINIWDTASGHEMISLQGHSGKVTSLVFSSDANWLAANGGPSVIIWGLANKVQTTLPTSRPQIVFSPDGSLAASFGRELGFEIWKVPSGDLLFSHSSGMIVEAAFSGIDKLVTAASEDNIHIWDLSQSEKIEDVTSLDRPFFLNDQITSNFSSRGDTIAFGYRHGGRLGITMMRVAQDTKTPSLLHYGSSAGGMTKIVSFNPEGALLARATDDGFVEIRPVDRRRVGAFSPRQHIVAFSPSGRIVAVIRNELTMLYDAETLHKIHKLEGHAKDVTRVAFDPNERLVATTSLDGTARIWKLDTGVEIKTLSVDRNPPLFSVAFSRDGKSLAAVSENGIATVWNWEDGQVLRAVGEKQEKLPNYSVNQAWFATVDKDQNLRRWDLSTGALLGSSNGAQDVFSNRDGSLFATVEGTGEVQVWDAGSEAILCRVGKPEGYVGARPFFSEIAFSDDSTRMASVVTSDHTVRIWRINDHKVTDDSKECQLLHRLTQSSFTSIAFDPRRTVEDTQLAFADNFGSVLILPPQWEKLRDLAKDKTTRRLNEKECLEILHMDKNCP